ncbi:conserved domain protein, partial [delta proteobacterium NaphS2]
LSPLIQPAFVSKPDRDTLKWYINKGILSDFETRGKKYDDLFELPLPAGGTKNAVPNLLAMGIEKDCRYFLQCFSIGALFG